MQHLPLPNHVCYFQTSLLAHKTNNFCYLHLSIEDLKSIPDSVLAINNYMYFYIVHRRQKCIFFPIDLRQILPLECLSIWECSTRKEVSKQWEIKVIQLYPEYN